MSIHKYESGELLPLDSASRVWTGTKAAWEALSDDSKPKNCLVCFTDDWTDNQFKNYTSKLVAGDNVTIENNTFCFVHNHICHFAIYFHSSSNKAAYSTIIKSGMPQIIQNTGQSTYQYHFPITTNAANAAPVASCYIAENTVGTIPVLTALTISNSTTSYLVRGTYMTNE